MSVILRGMEMPALCQECDLYIDGACYAKGYRDYRSIMDMSKPDDCPLIEVPTPHGRLIDVDALLTNTIYNPMSPPYITKEMVLDAKIVIGAEGGRGMTIVDVTKDSECCCSCIHNKRTFDKDCHCTCTCELDGHRIGYVANFESVCEEWERSEE